MSASPLESLTLRAKFVLGVSFMVVPFVLLLVVGILFAFLPTFGAIDEIVDEYRHELQPVDHLRVLVVRTARAVSSPLVREDEARRDAFRRLVADIDTTFKALLDKSIANPQERQIIERSHVLWERARPLVESLAGGDDGASDTTLTQFLGLVTAVDRSLSGFHQHSHEEIERQLQLSNELRQRGLLIFGAVAVIGLMGAVGAGITLSRSILFPMQQLTTAVRAFGRGNFAYRLQWDRRDEFGELGRVFRDMADEIERDRRALKEMALRDSLTGLYNRRAFDEQLRKLFEMASRYGRHLALLLVDLDHFKEINDSHGHQAGDLILREAARCIERCVRAADHVARYGGEEIAVIMPETDENQAFTAAERVRQVLELWEFRLDSGETLTLTVSIGVAGLDPGVRNADALVARADEALYLAKQQGRNRTNRGAHDSPPARTQTGG